MKLTVELFVHCCKLITSSINPPHPSPPTPPHPTTSDPTQSGSFVSNEEKCEEKVKMKNYIVVESDLILIFDGCCVVEMLYDGCVCGREDAATERKRKKNEIITPTIENEASSTPSPTHPTSLLASTESEGELKQRQRPAQRQEPSTSFPPFPSS